MEKCVKCSRPLSKAPRGRPPSYCGKGCRRSAEFEIRRLQRRIESLEIDLERQRGAREDGIADVYGRNNSAQRAALQKGIREAEERLRALLDTDADDTKGEMAK